jgi:hypothetical protein
MPSRQRVQQLVDMVEQGRFVEALQEFYDEDARTWENHEPPKVGLPRLIREERKVLATFKTIESSLVDEFFVQGDRAVLRWRFVFTHPLGLRIVMDELALQLWRGDKIVEERFYYDSAEIPLSGLRRFRRRLARLFGRGD